LKSSIFGEVNILFLSGRTAQNTRKNIFKKILVNYTTGQWMAVVRSKAKKRVTARQTCWGYQS
jgi:hypothetical protein